MDPNITANRERHGQLIQLSVEAFFQKFVEVKTAFQESATLLWRGVLPHQTPTWMSLKSFGLCFQNLIPCDIGLRSLLSFNKAVPRLREFCICQYFHHIHMSCFFTACINLLISSWINAFFHCLQGGYALCTDQFGMIYSDSSKLRLVWVYSKSNVSFFCWTSVGVLLAFFLSLLAVAFLF